MNDSSASLRVRRALPFVSLAFAGLVAGATLFSAACNTDDDPTTVVIDAGPDASDAQSDAAATAACVTAGYACTAVGACDVNTGHIVGDTTLASSCGGSSTVCCSLGADSCGGAETFECTNGTETLRPTCIDGALVCSAGFTESPLTNGVDSGTVVTEDASVDDAATTEDAATDAGNDAAIADAGLDAADAAD